MASIQATPVSEIVSTPVQADVFSHDSMVLYDLDSPLTRLTIEEIYVRLDEELDAIDSAKLKYSSEVEYIASKENQLQDIEYILCFLCELYRRNVNGLDFYWQEIYEIDSTNPRFEDKKGLYWSCFQSYKKPVKQALKKLRVIKEIQNACLKMPRMYQEIDDLMTIILDANGNNICEFKDYLTPDHYRLILSGADIKEFKEIEVLLVCLRKMKSIVR